MMLFEVFRRTPRTADKIRFITDVNIANKASRTQLKSRFVIGIEIPPLKYIIKFNRNG
jgi:hypothetical protein